MLLPFHHQLRIVNFLLVFYYCHKRVQCAHDGSRFLPDVLAEPYPTEGLETTDFEALLAALDRSQERLDLRKRQQLTQPFRVEGETTSPAMDDLVALLNKDDLDDESDEVGRLLQQDELAFCYDALYLADQNKDSTIDGNEFVTFVQIMGPSGFLPGANEFADLPLIMQSNFIILACLCLQQPSARPTCCTEDPHIDNNGTQPGQVPTTEQQQYLFQVCFLTETSIERVLASQEPSAAPGNPTTEPPQTPPPSTAPPVAPKPSNPPTNVPVASTPKPTPPPTKPPTKPPTPPPTKPPTPPPTMPPTPPPTKPPTDPPTKLPTEPPTKPPTEPTKGPTVPPTTPPTVPPTMPPTPQPTVAKTPQPTNVVSESPTAEPVAASPEPTAVGTGNATTVPTVAPSVVVTTDVPTAIPTVLPSLAPSEETTLIPTGTPVTQPIVSNQVVTTSYGIAVQNGNTEDVPTSSYTPDLEGAMNLLAQQVEEAWASNSSTAPNQRRALRASNNGGNQYQHRRRLSTTMVKVNYPTGVDGISPSECPGFVDSSSNSCEDVSASIPLIVVVSDGGTEDDVAAAVDSYSQDLNAAIEGGGLQAALEQVNPDSVVVVTTGYNAATTPPPSEDVSSSGGLSGGGIAGIVVGCVAVLIASYIALGKKRRREDTTNDEAAEEDLKDIDEAEMDAATGDDGDLKAASTPVEAIAASTTLASSSKVDEKGASPSKKKKSSNSGALYHVPGAKGVSDEGSSAGESGWSSNQDLSSVDSKSLDSAPSPSPMYVGGGEALVAVESVEEQVESNQSLEGQPSIPNDPSQEYSQTDTDTGLSLQSTYSELDQAIQKGDWAAVGVTAALLASQAYSTEDDSTAGSSKPKIQEKASLNPQRAAELDALVEAGDWEGVVAAAAKFDAQEALRGGSDSQVGSGSQHSRSHDSPSGGGSVGGSSTGTGPSFLSASGTIESTTSPSIGTAAGMTATSDTVSTRSKSRKLTEIREEVEALVNAVVPEEADNVDEMMTQFRGREEELVETLRSMQERQVAQKARLESQKQAKRDAKAYVETKQKDTFGAVDNAGNPADEAWMQDIDNANTPTPGEAAVGAAGAGAILAGIGGTMDPPREEDEQQEAEAMKEQLKIAIEREDWENVAEAASGLSGHAIGFNDYSRGDSDSPSNESVRSQDINALVDKGDWDAVVAAASRYVESDKNANRSTSAEETEKSIEERRKRRQERLKEEEEALAQAEIWNAIAEQTKAESKQEEENANVAGANLAAAWAIDRSLSALRKAEVDEQARDSDKKKEDDDDADREV